MILKGLNKREKFFLYVAGGAIAFAIAFNFALYPAFERNEKLNAEINAERAKLKKYLWLLGQKENIQGKFSNQKISGAGSAGGDKVIDALAELENIARSGNIKIIDLRPQPTRPAGLYKETLIELRTSGTMEAYLKFFYGLDSSLFLFKVKKFQLSSRPNTSSLEGSLTIAQLSE